MLLKEPRDDRVCWIGTEYKKREINGRARTARTILDSADEGRHDASADYLMYVISPVLPNYERAKLFANPSIVSLGPRET